MQGERRSNTWLDFMSMVQLVDSSLISHIQIETDKDVIVFTGSSDHLEQLHTQLTENMKVPEVLLAKLGYVMTAPEAPKPSSDPVSVVVQSVENSPKGPLPNESLAILSSLFGDEFIVEDGIKLVWSDFFEEQVNAPVLLSQQPLSSVNETIWSTYIEIIVARIATLPVSLLRQMYTGSLTLSQVQNYQSSPTDHCVDESLLKKIFGFTEIAEQRYLYCDCSILHNMLYPPEIVRIETAVGHGEAATPAPELSRLHVDKRHFITYLNQVYKEFILHLEGGSARRILLPSPCSTAVRNVFVLMLDVSSSMREDLDNDAPEYKRAIKSTLSLLSSSCDDPDASVFIVPFSNNETLTIERFSLSDVQSASTFVDGLVIGGSTKIYGTLSEILEHPKIKLACPVGSNFTIIMTTDGDDNFKTDDHKKILQDKKLETKTAWPQVFALGIGINYDKSLCDAIATLTGGQHLQLRSSAELQQLEAHLEAVTQSRTLFELSQSDLTSAAAIINTAFVSVYDSPHIVDEHIQSGRAFSVNGQSYVFYPRECHVELAPSGAPSTAGSFPSLWQQVTEFALSNASVPVQWIPGCQIL